MNNDITFEKTIEARERLRIIFLIYFLSLPFKIIETILKYFFNCAVLACFSVIEKSFF
jgi:hypothetical protein